jgi:exodeoxyribonuclease VII small subunit
MSDFKKIDSNGEEPTFEAGLAELQELVRVLEEGALGLDESIARFERGISILRRCYQALERAEQKIELLTGFDRDGNPVTAPFDGSATLDPSNSVPARRPSRSSRKKCEPDDQAELSSPEDKEPDKEAKDRTLPLF